jgi:hypothetical protein
MRLAVPHFNRLIGPSSWDTFPSGNVCSWPTGKNMFLMNTKKKNQNQKNQSTSQLNFKTVSNNFSIYDNLSSNNSTKPI